MNESGYLIRLDFESPLRIGEPGIGMERSLGYIPSDTLFSAVCVAWATIYGERSLEELIDQSRSDTLFCFSSAFPRLTIEKDGDTKETYYLPRPFLHELLPEPVLPADKEKANAIRDEVAKRTKDGTKTYVNMEFFQELVSERLVDMKAYIELDRASRLFRLVHQKHLFPRLSLDRISCQSNLFFCQSVRFGSSEFKERDGQVRARGGLFFLLRVGSEEVAAKLRSCLDLLGEQGIGGERSLGYGRFKTSGWDKPRTLFPKVDNPQRFVVLSLYHPSGEERQRIKERGGLLGYQLIRRGGWIDSPFITGQQRKKSCFMFEEGSVFDFEPRGEVFDVTPVDRPAIHRIYRSGIAFAVGVRL